jgi:hypothetical protein
MNLTFYPTQKAGGSLSRFCIITWLAVINYAANASCPVLFHLQIKW